MNQADGQVSDSGVSRFFYFRLLNLIGCISVFIDWAPFSTHDESKTNLTGNLLLDITNNWWIQPFVFGILSIQAEIYLWPGYLDTVMMKEMRATVNRESFNRQMVEEVSA